MTAFFAGRGPNAENLWEVMTGESPATITQQLPLQNLRQEGPYAGGRIVVVQSPSRLDVVFIPLDPAGVFPDEDAARQSFLRATNALFDSGFVIETVRLAYGSVLIESVENRQEGYTRLGQFLPTYQFEDGLSDFMLQVNHRRTSTTQHGIDMNRLSKWSVQVSQSMVFGVTGSGLQTLQHGQEQRYACRCELDINSVPEHVLPPSADLQALLTECTELGSELGEKGPIV